jgi:hypothetical protein
MAKGISTDLWISAGGAVNLHRGEIVGEIETAGGDLNICGGSIGPGAFSELVRP